VGWAGRGRAPTVSGVVAACGEATWYAGSFTSRNHHMQTQCHTRIHQGRNSSLLLCLVRCAGSLMGLFPLLVLLVPPSTLFGAGDLKKAAKDAQARNDIQDGEELG